MGRNQTTPPVADLLGRTFGVVTVQQRSVKDRHGKVQWTVLCRCGTLFITRGSDLLAGKVLSCGRHCHRPRQVA